MSLRPIITVTQSFPSCNTIRFCDSTPLWNNDKSSADYYPYGYESELDYPCAYPAPNIKRSEVTSTKIFVKAPNAEDFKLFDADFMPINGCIDFNTDDLETADIEVEDLCNCCDDVVEPVLTPLTLFSDGCWEFKYEVYAEGESAAFDLEEVSFPNTFVISIDGTEYDLGEVVDIYYLTLAINELDLGAATYSGTTVTIVGLHTYDYMDSGGVISPTVTEEEILAGSTEINKFFHCFVAGEVFDDMMNQYATDCRCDTPEMTAMLMDIRVCYETMIDSSKKLGCNCDCTLGYLEVLQLKLTRFNEMLTNGC